MSRSGRTCSGVLKGMVANITSAVTYTFNRFNLYQVSHFMGSGFAAFDTN